MYRKFPNYALLKKIDLKLRNALFVEPYPFYGVSREPFADNDNSEFADWDLEPLMGPTLAREYVKPFPFDGKFIISGKIVSSYGPLLNCYLEIVLPERVCEHHFVQLNGEIVHCRGQRAKSGTAIPAVGIEQLGVYKLFYARENPEIGIEILQTALRSARSKIAIGYDLGLLLRDEKEYEKAIEVFSLVLSEEPESEISYVIHKERAQLYEAIGNQDKAGKDRRSWMVDFEKKYGHLPGADDSV